jgi:predicted HTH transcriptional regulator
MTEYINVLVLFGVGTIAGFMNKNGGILLIGIDDNGKILGLKNDMETLKKKNVDGFLQHFTHTLVSLHPPYL